MLSKRKVYHKIIVIQVILLLTCTLFSFNATAVYAAESFPGAVPYTVRSGDTLFIIAQKYGTTVDVLRVANGIETDMLYPGQVLNIPGNTSKIFTRYTVARGDTLYLIARKFGVSVYALKYANSLTLDMIVPGQPLVIPFMQFKALADILADKGITITSPSSIDILVDKSEHTLLLFSRGRWLKTYHVELGSGGLGAKQVMGDKKTPEGLYYACEKSVIYDPSLDIGTRWIRVSYPNIQDGARGLRQGLIDTNKYNAIVSAIRSGAIPPQDTALGEGVGIHGGTMPVPDFEVDWTWGCIGLTNADSEDFYNFINVGTRIVIQK